jgi:hypothetical protein
MSNFFLKALRRRDGKVFIATAENKGEHYIYHVEGKSYSERGFANLFTAMDKNQTVIKDGVENER